MDASAESPFAHRTRSHRASGAAGDIVIRDRSNIARTGFKGRGTTGWLRTHMDPLPERPNQAVMLDGGAIVARLGSEEYLVLDGVHAGGSIAARLDREWHGAAATADRAIGFPLPRADSHSWLSLEGRRVPEMMARICGVDLRDPAFGPGSVAQTIVARIGAIVIRDGQAEPYALHLLTDFASARYLADVLEDAVQEFGGGFAAG